MADRRFIFNVEGDEPCENDDVIGCVLEDDRMNDRICICVSCGAEDCIYRGSMRVEVD